MALSKPACGLLIRGGGADLIGGTPWGAPAAGRCILRSGQFFCEIFARGFLFFVSLFLLIERIGHFSGSRGHFSCEPDIFRVLSPNRVFWQSYPQKLLDSSEKR